MTRDELELLTVRQLAELWNVSPRTIERRVAEGRIPSVMVGGRRLIRAVDAARIAAGGTTYNPGTTSSTTERGSR